MRAETLKGHLDGMLLASLEAGPRHGYAIMEALRAGSGGQLDLPTGTLSGAAPARAGRPRTGQLVHSRGAPAPRLPADPRRPAGPGRRARQLAGILRRRHQAARTRATADSAMNAHAPRTAGTASPGPASAQPIESYLAQVTAALPGPARADIVAELRDGLLDATDAHVSAGLAPPAAAQAAVAEFGHPAQVAAAFRPGLAASQARHVAATLLATGLAWAAAARASHIGVHDAPPWQWAGTPLAAPIAFPSSRRCSSSPCGQHSSLSPPPVGSPAGSRAVPASPPPQRPSPGSAPPPRT
jgi:hypothetical protein